MAHIYEDFPGIAAAVQKTHEQVGLHSHHDWIHAIRVGNVAMQVALDEWGDQRLAHLAGIAGLCHNADRIIQKSMSVGRGNVPKERVIALISNWVREDLNAEEIATVIKAVLGHDGLNADTGSPVCVRTQLGMQMARDRKELFDMNIAALQQQLESEGILPYSFK